MRLVVSAFVTPDGVMEGPGRDEHRDGRNAWALRVQNEEDQRFGMQQIRGAEVFLLGRRTWQIGRRSPDEGNLTSVVQHDANLNLRFNRRRRDGDSRVPRARECRRPDLLGRWLILKLTQPGAAS